MSTQYGELFQELYTQKYVQPKPQQNAIQRIQEMQKKMREQKSFRRHHQISQIAIEHYPNLQNIDRIHEDAPKKVRRNLIPKKKKLSFKANEMINRQKSHQGHLFQKKSISNQKLKQEGKVSPHRSFTYRVQPGSSTPLSNDKNLDKQYRKFYKIRTVDRNRSNRRKDSIHNEKRCMTPSKNVMIGGRNLQKQAQSYKVRFKKFEEELEKYQKSIHNETLQHRKKSIRSQKQMRKQKLRQTLRESNIFMVSKKKQKQDNVELQPWSVMAEYQFY